MSAIWSSTGWADLGIDFLIGEMLITHSMGHNVQAYIHTTVEARKREALEKWHAHLDAKRFAVIHGLEGVQNKEFSIGLEATLQKDARRLKNQP